MVKSINTFANLIELVGLESIIFVELLSETFLICFLISIFIIILSVIFFKDKISLELLEIIFPQLKNLQNFKKLNSYGLKNLSKIDFIFLISLLIVDGTDNVDYFIYKFNISKKDQKRLKVIDSFYKENVSITNFTEKNFNKIFYFNGRQAALDIINFKLFSFCSNSFFCCSFILLIYPNIIQRTFR